MAARAIRSLDAFTRLGTLSQTRAFSITTRPARKLSAELNGDGAAAQRSSSSLREKLASLRRGLSDATNKLQQGL